MPPSNNLTYSKLNVNPKILLRRPLRLQLPSRRLPALRSRRLRTPGVPQRPPLRRDPKTAVPVMRGDRPHVPHRSEEQGSGYPSGGEEAVSSAAVLGCGAWVCVEV